MTFGLQLLTYELPSAGGQARGEVPLGSGTWHVRRGDMPTFTHEWSALAKRSSLLAAPCVVAVRYWDGTQWVEGRDSRFVIKSDRHDRVSDDHKVHSATYRGLVSLLDGATVWDALGGATTATGPWDRGGR